MSYYRPSYSQTVAMSRGGGRGFSSSRGSSYRGGGGRGNSSWGGSARGGYGSSRGNSSARFSSSFNNSFETRKYGGASRHEEEYRKPYKTESGGYGRDHRSPERKRMRTGSSHDRSFGSSGDYGHSRYESDRRSFSGDRRPSGPFARKEEFRKPPPPVSSPRGGGYRGRMNSSRGGSMRARLRDRPVVARRRLIESSYTVRRRVLPGRTSDFTRRLKMPRLRSSILRRPKKEEILSDKEDSEPEEEEEEKKADKSGEIKDTSDKEDGDEEKKSSPVKKEEATSEKEEGKESIGEGGDEKPSKSTFIKLICPHCLIRCTTFGKYSLHLQSGRHASAMRRVALKQKAILGQMRLVQRKAQRELEKTTDDLAPRTSWCQLCKLNYKQPKLTHQATQAHKDMKKFLMPYCKICKITFKSPMIYESHCCSIDHIKRKTLLANGDKSDTENVSGNEDDPMENFMTIDSVGDMDEDGDSAEKKEGGEPKVKEQINVGIENIRKVEVHYCDLCRMYLPRAHEDEEMQKILARHCKLRTHLQKYIRYKEDKELAKRAERLQRKETAEKEKEKDKEDVKTDTEEKESPEKKEKDDEAKDESAPNPEDEKLWADVDKDIGDILAEAGSCHKSSDEDEEDSVVNGERYDRFKYSEKAEDIKEKKVAVVVEEEEEEKKVEEETEVAK